MSLLMKIVTILTGIALFLTPLYISISGSEAICGGVVITIADSTKHRFVTEDDIMNALKATGIRVTGARVSEIPTHETGG